MTYELENVFRIPHTAEKADVVRLPHVTVADAP